MMNLLQIFRIACAGLLLAGLFSSVFAQTDSGNVQGRLIASHSAVRPGQSFWVGLELTHADHWHTYWENPGDAGLATSIDWSLPEGWSASSIHWPVPKVFLQEDIVNYVYEGVTVLPVQVTVSQDARIGESVQLEAKVRWLECDPSMCVPGGAALSLQVGMASTSATASGKQAIETALGSVAELPDGWDASVTLADSFYTILLKADRPVSGIVDDVYLFSEAAQSVNALPTDAALDPELRRSAEEDGRFLVVESPSETELVLRVAASEFFEGQPDRFPAVIKAGAGWPVAGSPRGLRVNPRVVDSSAIGSGASLETPGGNVASVSPAQVEKTESIGLFVALTFGWLGGLILNLMPCVFPVIGLKVMGFVNQAGSSRGEIIRHGLAFTAGVVLSFWVLAALVIVLGRGWGFQMENAGFVLGMLLFFLLFGLNMAGLFEIGGSAVGVGSNLQSQHGLRGSFFSGLLATVVATPCSAPFLAGALGATITMSAAANFLVFTAIGIGLSTPYLVLCLFPSLMSRLPRPGQWMESLKQGLAFLLFAFCGYLAYTFAGQMESLGEPGQPVLLGTFLGLAVVALAAWIYGRWAAPACPRQQRRIATGVALALLLGTAGSLFAGLAGATERAREIALIQSGQARATDFLVWDDWSSEAVAAGLEAGRPVYIDFTARWCATCQVNKRVYRNDRVVEAFLDRDVLLLRADKTTSNPQIDAAIESYGRKAVPLNIMHLPGEREPVVLPSVLTADAVIKSLEGGGGV